MTFQLPTVITQTFSSCLSDPGSIIPKLYRSDGITQNTVLEQLFANFFRVEPYEYITSSSQENALRAIEQYFAINKNEFETHLQSEHTEAIEELNVHEHCGNNCIVVVLNAINGWVQEYSSAIRLEIEGADDEEIMEKVLEKFNTYVTFMVIVEDKLPSLSFIIKRLASQNYPYSLWKLLYERFMEHLYAPLEERLREILVEGVKKLRVEAIEKVINKQETAAFDFGAFDNICKLHEVSLLLAGKHLNEKSVYFTESTTYTIDITLDQAMKSQTTELYQQYNMPSIDKTAILNADMNTIKGILTPSQTSKLLSHCINIASSIWDLDKDVESVFECLECKDAEIEMHAKRLGIVE